MTFAQLAIVWPCLLAAALALAGLLLRGRARFCRLFTCYLFVMLLSESLVMVWPSLFWTWSFWLFKQAVFDVLKIATALELAYWIFLGFPGAAERARGVVFLFLVATLIAVIALPNEIGRDQAGYFLGQLRARLGVGTAWIFTALAALVRWYRIPLHPMHRTLIISFTGYLLVFSTVMKLAVNQGITTFLSTIEPIAYTAICFWWAWEAWQREPEMAIDPALVARLQPWKARAC